MVSRKDQIAILLAVTFFIVAVFCFEHFPKNSFALGLKIGGINVGGISQEKAQKKLTLEIEKFLEKPVSFSYSSKNKETIKKTTLKELGLMFDLDESTREAFELGKREGFFENLKVKLKALFGKYNFPLSVFFSDKEKLENFLGSHFGQYETFPQNAQVVFNKNSLDFEIIPAKSGMMFPLEGTEREIIEGAKFLQTKNIKLQLKEKMPEIKEEQVINSLKEARELLQIAPLHLKADNKGVLLKKDVFGNLIDFIPERGEDRKLFYKITLNEEMVQNYLLEISNEINIEPQNPILNFEEGKIKIVSPPKKGKVLVIEKSAEILKQKALAKEKEIPLASKEVDPEITEDKIKDLKIETLVGKGVSNFSGSPKNRIHNIKIASTKLSGILLGPQKEFSFNQALGPVGPEGGYLPELVIKPKKTIPEYGGGVCQVSTTLFRAAINSGLEIKERHPHSYPVRYYGAPGFDATVYFPSPDLRFKNNTPGYILIQSKIEGNNLIFEVYGRNDGREVVIKGPSTLEVKSDGSIKTRLDQEVWREGELILRKSFFSTYKPAELYPVSQ